MGRGEGNGPRVGLGQEKERGELVPRGKVGPAGLGGFWVWADQVFCFSYFLSPFSFKPTEIDLNSNQI